MMTMPGSGVQIRLADGGYIIQWMDRSKPQEPKAQGYLEQERQAIGGCFPGQYLHLRSKYKCAVRVKLEDALKLAGEILSKMHEMGVEEDDMPESFIAGA